MCDTGGIAYIVAHPLILSFDSDAFETISRTAKSSGLNSDYLRILCSWIESKEIDEKYKLKLIECLIPEPNGGNIPEDVCIRLSSLLKSSKISLISKVEILKWMICAHSFMETDGQLLILYEMFLGLLKNKEMRPYAAHFLYLITQNKHVTFRRVKCLYSFMDEYGRQPCFRLLMRSFFMHAPEYFDDELKEDPLCQFESLGAYPSLIRKVHCAYKPNFSNIIITATDSSSTGLLSEFDTINEKISEASTPRLSPFEQLYKQFRALERSTDVSDILASRLRYLFLTTRLKRTVQIKIEDYIISLLHAAYESEDIVEIYSDYFHFQRSFPGMSEFTEFLLIKDDSNPDIAEALCFEPVCCFKKIEIKLQLIRGKFLTTEDTELKCQWLNSLSKMFCYWMLQIKKSIPCDGTCNESDSDVSDTPIHHIPVTEISQLGSEIDFLCNSLIMEDSSPFVLNQVLQHYQMGAIACMQKEKFIPCFPSPAVFQLSLFSLTPFILETLCGFILRINAILNSQTHALNNEVTIFQASVNDIKKVFMGGSYKTESTYLAKTKTFKRLIKRRSEFKNAFILHKHPALFLTILEFGKKNGDPKSVLTNPESRREFFSYLAENGCKDFLRLINKIK